MTPALLTLLAAAHAGDALTFSAVTTATQGGEPPKVVFHPGVDGRLRAEARCGDRAFPLASELVAGRDVDLPLPLPAGTHSCAVEVTLEAADGSVGDLGFSVDVAVLDLLTASVTYDDYDRAAGTLVVHASRPVVEGRATVIGAKGAELDQVPALLSDPANPRFSWQAGGREVVKVVAELRDAHGFQAVIEALPWYYDIPHEDVVFASGDHAIRPSEVPKLERSWAEIVHTLELYGEVVPIQLFVAGYTDTVGDAASNRGLSERRARALATWFRERGFTGPIGYQGFGEGVLAVPTPDETDDARNRRALYLLSSEPPPPSRDLPSSSWRRL